MLAVGRGSPRLSNVSTEYQPSVSSLYVRYVSSAAVSMMMRNVPSVSRADYRESLQTYILPMGPSESSHSRPRNSITPSFDSIHNLLSQLLLKYQ